MKESLHLTALIAVTCTTSALVAYSIPKLISYFKRKRINRFQELLALVKKTEIELDNIPEDQLVLLEVALKEVLSKIENACQPQLLSSDSDKYFTPQNDSDQTKDSEELQFINGVSWKFIRDGFHNQEQFDEWKFLVEENSNRQFYIECANYYSKNTVSFRKNRMSFLGLSSPVDFIIKLHAIRSAFTIICDESENVTMILKSVKEIIILVFKISGKLSAPFEGKFDSLVAFCQDENNKLTILEELESRKLTNFTVYDVLLDFMIMDSLSDLDNIPNAMVSVLQNRWLPKLLKENAFCNLVWSLIQTRMKFLQHNDGFLGKFYGVCESINPLLAWGILGDQDVLNEACVFLKDTFVKYMKNIFNQNKMSYDSVNDLSSDILRGTKKMLTRMRNKLNSLL